MAMEVVYEDVGEENTQCPNHPYKNSSPGGICAFCLQEKLGKLVSSSPPFPPSPNPPRSAAENGGASAPRLPSSASAAQNRAAEFENSGPCSRKPRLPFVLTAHKKNSIKDSDSAPIVFNRSKSTATPRRKVDGKLLRRGLQPKRQKGFLFKDSNFIDIDERKEDEFVAVDQIHQESPSNFSRSRSVGCESRSFSGFGDCTLRRVESQREGGCENKLKVQPSRNVGNNGDDCGGRDCIKERVKCGGIFGGFMLASSVEESNVNHGIMRSKSWVWAFASPIRTFGKHTNGKKDANKNSYVNGSNSLNKNRGTTPNLAPIPSLLAVGGLLRDIIQWQRAVLETGVPELRQFYCCRLCFPIIPIVLDTADEYILKDLNGACGSLKPSQKPPGCTPFETQSWRSSRFAGGIGLSNSLSVPVPKRPWEGISISLVAAAVVYSVGSHCREGDGEYGGEKACVWKVFRSGLKPVDGPFGHV
ncbi:RNA-binding KH domain-containing protein [Striga asiatica]|uniref:RNA-binding KH domain-containing protein n=1 Tax=Striga asiatica TaxID=4170 RepID=A0A5A7RGZ3_STRAF|nr:RNA-binding KH domain-containing protein [Striga asiatica]